jgi:hypothetical protein
MEYVRVRHNARPASYSGEDLAVLQHVGLAQYTVRRELIDLSETRACSQGPALLSQEELRGMRLTNSDYRSTVADPL